MAIYNNIPEAIGHTPIIRLQHLGDPDGAQILYAAEKGALFAVEIRELVLNPIHDVGCRGLWADFQDAENEGTILFQIRRVVPHKSLLTFILVCDTNVNCIDSSEQPA